jgi:hypothetical protein
VWRNETDQSLALSPLERAFGSDVLIDEKTGDIAWTENDLALAYGIDNIGQFIRFRATLTKGLFRRASRLGFSRVIGFSAGVSESVIAAEARGMFKDDERISSCEVVDIKRIGQALSITLMVRVKNRQDPIIQTVVA